MLALVKRNWQMYKRYFPFTLFCNRILDSFFQLLSLWLLAHYLFNNIPSNSTISIIGSDGYFTYASLGMLFFNLNVGVLMNVGRALITEVREGTLQSLLIAPYSILNYYFGVFLEQLWRVMLEFFIVFFIAKLLGARFGNYSVVNIVIGMLLVIVSSFCMSIFLSNIMLYLRETFISQNTLFILIFFLSGITFPRELLPKSLYYFGMIIPTTHIMSSVRFLLANKGNFFILTNQIIIGIALSIIYFFLGIFWYRKVERKVISYIFC